MKYLLIVIFTALVVGLGVAAYFKDWFPSISFNKPQAVSVQNSEVSGVPAVTPEPFPTASATPSVGFTIVKAGGGVIPLFYGYTIEVPSDWTYVKSGSSDPNIKMDVLTITNGDYKININQSASSGSTCLYPGDADTEISTRFSEFKSVTTQSGEVLRVGSAQPGSYTACQNQNNTWGTFTSFGHIDISTPVNPSNSTLNQINTILSSIKKN